MRLTPLLVQQHCRHASMDWRPPGTSSAAQLLHRHLDGGGRAGLQCAFRVKMRGTRDGLCIERRAGAQRSAPPPRRPSGWLQAGRMCRPCQSSLVMCPFCTAGVPRLGTLAGSNLVGRTHRMLGLPSAMACATHTFLAARAAGRAHLMRAQSLYAGSMGRTAAVTVHSRASKGHKLRHHASRHDLCADKGPAARQSVYAVHSTTRSSPVPCRGGYAPLYGGTDAQCCSVAATMACKGSFVGSLAVRQPRQSCLMLAVDQLDALS